MDKFIRILRVALLLFIFTWVVIWYTGRVQKSDKKSRNLIERTVRRLAYMPELVILYFQETEEHFEKIIEPNNDLYEIGKLPDNSGVDESYYLLHYRYMGDKTGYVYLQNIKNGEIAYSWKIPLRKLMMDTKATRKELFNKYKNGQIAVDFSASSPKNVSALKISSPIMTKDSSLLFRAGHVYKIDKDSKLLWKSEKTSHHTLALDEQENIWACSVDIDSEFANQYGFRDDALLCLYPNGEEKHFFPLTEIFTKNDLFKRLIASNQSYPHNQTDPYHLNDILPVDSDGIYWKKGDVFFSLRHKSMIALYRPSTDSIVWQQKGPWLGQHDINIVNDSIISVFNNNACFSKVLDSSSNIACFNFANGQTSYFAEGLFDSYTEGLQTLTENTDLIIEETADSKYLVLDSQGNLKGKFYIPYYSDSLHAHYPCRARVYIKKDKQFIMQ
ncbi:MAG: arylsulfotransferase family protein [Bacteroidales bacterium]|nr:arylsulfotransferase family protein [Bacteroidales bacterium]MCF8455155.1 arylsulfotransferase family protein [Bacteroidales bacterium]